jgi:lipoprotein-releasing system ATP-binding protein
MQPTSKKPYPNMSADPFKISLRNASKVYEIHGHRVTAVDNVSLEIADSTCTAIVGKSGSGKSTLLHLLSSLERPTTGDVVFNGRNLNDMQDSEVASMRGSKVGVVFQMNNLLPEFSALENVQMPALIGGLAKNETLDRANQLLDKVGLGHRRHHRPSEMSGGEQQRVAVARAMVMRPRILFADEPTGNLDERTSLEVQDLFFSIVDVFKIGLVMVTHDGDLAARLPSQIRMEDGCITGIDGTA